jgi:MFS family permease
MENSKKGQLNSEVPSENGNAKSLIDTKKKFSWNQTFSSLKHDNYRLWFTGQIISLFGSWMQITAQGYFIFELTHSPAFLGYVGFANGIPTWLFMAYAGVIADKFHRRNILVVTQTIMMILAFILAGLTFTHLVQPWHIILLTFFLGMANAFDAPARQAFVNELVSKEDLLNAIALNGTMFHTALMLGPAIGGVTYALFGPGWCFTINGVSFIAVIYNLLKMKFRTEPKKVVAKSNSKAFLDGLRYLKTQKLILRIMLIVSSSTFLGMSLVTLFPAWAVNILHGGAATNGLLQSARGVGAFICSLFIASFSKHLARGKVLTTGLIAMPIFLILFSLSNSFMLCMLILVGIGAATMAINNLANGIIQTVVEEEFRGRVMGIYSLCFFSLMPIGALLVGTMAEHLGSPTAVLINGILLLVFSAGIWIASPALRKIK